MKAGLYVEAYPDLTALSSAVEQGRPRPDAVLAGCLPDPVAGTAAAATALALRILDLARSWTVHARFGDVPLVILTRDAVPAEGTEADPAGAAVWGLIRCAQLADPGRFVLADVDGHRTSWKALASALATGEPQLALRHGTIRAPRLVKVEKIHERAGFDPDPNGTVLLTGVDPDFGPALAQHLVQRYRVTRLLLAVDSAAQATVLSAALTTVMTAAPAGFDALESIVVQVCDPADRTALAALLAGIDPGHPLTATIHLGTIPAIAPIAAAPIAAAPIDISPIAAAPPAPAAAIGSPGVRGSRGVTGALDASGCLGVIGGSNAVGGSSGVGDSGVLGVPGDSGASGGLGELWEPGGSDEASPRWAAALSAAANLHELAGSASAGLVLFSAAAGTIGVPGHETSAAVAAFLDALATRRGGQGRRSISLAWGPWESTPGGAGSATLTGSVPSGQVALVGLSPDEGLELFDAAMRLGLPAVLPVRFDHPALAAARPQLPLLRTLLRIPNRRSAALKPATATATALRRTLSGLAEAERSTHLVHLVRAEVAAVLDYNSADAVLDGQVFREIGLNSLTAFALRNRLLASTGVRLPAALLFELDTPTRLAEHLKTELLGS